MTIENVPVGKVTFCVLANEAALGKDFDTEEFEAIATIPAPEPDMKGKVLDCVQTGYTLFDKVIRHAKVVVGE